MNEKQAKYLKRLVVVFLSLWCFFALMQGLAVLHRTFQPESPAVRAQKHFKDPSKLTKHIRVNGADYDIPVSYFRVRVPREAEDTRIYLVWMYPEFSPLRKSEKEFFGENNRNIVSDLAADIRTKIPFDEIVRGVLEGGNRFEVTGSIYGLDIYDPEKQRGDGRKIPYIYRKANGDVLTVISCYPDWIRGARASGGRPSCTQSFVESGLLHQLTYDKILLPYWRELEASTRSLYQQFREEASRKNLSAVVIPPEQATVSARILRTDKKGE